MTLTGTNKLCQQCTNTCKQFKQVVVAYCPDFKSRYERKKSETDKKAN